MTDEDDLQKLARGLATPDLDAGRAARIAEVARRDVGHRPKRRVIEALVVGSFVSLTLVWALFKVLEVLR